ncbi:MAG: 16S rRNA (cytosine(1402)-N(4))-methyltransferase RsmH [Magnetovibrionaceae bacterium]
MMAEAPHIPVLLNEVVGALQPKDGGTYVDATFGNGGYTRALLGAADTRVLSIDRDPAAMGPASALSEEFPGRFRLLTGCFGDMARLLAEADVLAVDGIAFDLGVSSMQLDQPDRGFSFKQDGPLDMRMSSEGGETAADLVNRLAEAELADLIYQLGEERQSRRIARAIVADRAKAPFLRTGELAALVRRVVRPSKDGIDPATRTFQALRIQVNDELGELDRGLIAAEALLSPGGRLAVVSFHSLEDRRVKSFLTDRSGRAARPSRHLPDTAPRRSPSFDLVKKGTIKPQAAECARNPRSRSARLRVAERTGAPAWGLPVTGRASGESERAGGVAS